MTPLEEHLRATLRNREADITVARIRLDFTDPQATTPARRWRNAWLAVPVMVGAAMAGVIAVAVGVGGLIGGDASPPPMLTPAASSSPTTDAAAGYRLWLSETVIPATGADLVAVLIRAGGPDVAYGPGAFVDRWDGTTWQPYRWAQMCPEICAGTLYPVEQAGTGPQPAYGHISDGTGPGAGTGPGERVIVEGLEPGLYRLRRTMTEIGDDSGATRGEEVEAIGEFEVVDGGAATVPLDDPAADQLFLFQAVLPTTGGTVSFIRPDLAPELPTSWPPSDVELERWTGTGWDHVGTHPTTPSSAATGAAEVTVSATEPGAYRIIDITSSPLAAQGVFWVSDLGTTQ